MENKRAIIISLICFLVSMLLINAYVSVKEKELTSSFGEWVDVVVAEGPYFDKNKTNSIPEYATIQPDMVSITKVFKSFKQPLTVTKPEDVIGKAAYVPIAEGEQVTLTKLVQPDGKPVLEQQVELKQRAVTLLVSPQNAVGRLIRPGNRVDVLIAPLYDANGTTMLEVKTLIQNALVLATGKHLQNEVPTRVDRELLGYLEEANAKVKRKDLFPNNTDALNTSRPDDNYANITLQLNEDDAQKIIFLTHKFGDRAVYLTLRNSTDIEVVKAGSTILDDVLGPNSDYGRSKQRPLPITPPKPRYQDMLGNQPVPRY